MRLRFPIAYNNVLPLKVCIREGGLVALENTSERASVVVCLMLREATLCVFENQGFVKIRFPVKRSGKWEQTLSLLGRPNVPESIAPNKL